MTILLHREREMKDILAFPIFVGKKTFCYGIAATSAMWYYIECCP